MPKTRKAKPRGSVVQKADPLRFKFKLGGRKSTTSALAMSTEALVEKFNTAPGKDKVKIMKVLHSRNVHIGSTAEEELAAENED
jgi:hypothetical protein